MKKLQSVHDPSFGRYGRVLDPRSFAEISAAAEAIPYPAEGVAYDRSVPALEATADFAFLQDVYAGGQTLQAGLCWGYNRMMNAVEYHRASEVNIAVTDVVVMLGDRRDIRDNAYNSDLMEFYLVPKGAAVEFYATTLHYAPCGHAEDAFRAIVILPRGTNAALTPEAASYAQSATGEARLLTAVDKWLLCHPDAPEAANGACSGIKGENLKYVFKG